MPKKKAKGYKPKQIHETLSAHLEKVQAGRKMAH